MTGHIFQGTELKDFRSWGLVGGMVREGNSQHLIKICV